MEWKYTNIPVKKKSFSKEGHADSVLGHERTHHY